MEEISKINKRINKSGGGGGGGGGGSSFSSTPTYGGVGAFQGPITGFDLTQPEDD